MKKGKSRMRARVNLLRADAAQYKRIQRHAAARKRYNRRVYDGGSQGEES